MNTMPTYYPSSELQRQAEENVRNHGRKADWLRKSAPSRYSSYLNKEIPEGSGEPDFFNIDNDPEYVAWVESQYD